MIGSQKLVLDNMEQPVLLCVHRFEQLMQIKMKLKVTAYYYFVRDGEVHQYDRIRDKAWLKTDLSSLRDRVKHLPMVWCPYMDGRIEMYYSTQPDKVERAYHEQD